MLHCKKPTAMFACFTLLVFLAATYMPDAMAQDTTKPLMADLSEGVPMTGGDFTVRFQVTDDSGVSSVHLYPYFILPPPGDPIVLTVILMEPMPGNIYETLLEIPNNAMELKYSAIAKDLASNWQATDVITRRIADDKPPLAICETTISLSMGSVHTFDGSASTDNVGIANYTWFFQYGGGTVSLYGPNASFNFLVSGQYSGSLTVKDFWGNSNLRTFQVSVGDTERPVANAGTQMHANAGIAITFDGSASTDNVGITNYIWSFVHNGTQIILHNVSPSFVFWTPGVYEVALTVRDAAGNTDTTLLSVQVIDAGSETGELLPWWAYVMLVMVCIFALLGYFMLRN